MIRKALAGLALAAIPAVAFAQDPYAAAGDSGDTAWILTCSALVLLMCLPGLALFYGGLVRAKNLLSVTMQCGAVAAAASTLWVVIGYTMAFGSAGNGWLGGFDHFMLRNLGNIRANTTLPESTFALFQMMFAAITPALMVGAWVDRARFSWVLGFCALWGLVVYAPAAHWVWGGGWLASSMGTLDFAGGIVVHTTAGISGLVIALLLGRRIGFPGTPLLPHAPGLTMIGAMLLWVGWFGFNGGSALTATDDASAAIINTHVAACTAALVWVLIERFTFGKPTSVGFATGAIAGLATITPAAGYVSPGAAILFGALGSGVCYSAIQAIKLRLKIDDSLDVFAVHGVGGMLGSVLLGIFISADLGGTGFPQGATMFSQIGAQVVGVVAVAIWSAIATVVLALGVSLIAPMRVGRDEETEGLDITSHGERGWEFD